MDNQKINPTIISRTRAGKEGTTTSLQAEWIEPAREGEPPKKGNYTPEGGGTRDIAD